MFATRVAFPIKCTDKGWVGSSGQKEWIVRYHAGEKKQELSVTPEGVIIRLPVPVEVKDLPRPVADAIAKDGKARTLKVKPDGSIIKEFQFPKKK
jgi:hypothetical protein